MTTETQSRDLTAEEQLQAKLREKRIAAGLPPDGTSPISAAKAGRYFSGTAMEQLPAVETENRACPQCEAVYRAVKMPSGSFAPAQCPSCNPTKPDPESAEVTPKLSFDVLEALNDAGVNVHKYRDATLANWIGDSIADRSVKVIAEGYIRTWDRTRGERFPARDWMYFYGSGSSYQDRGVQIGATGNGKTFLSIAIARHLIETGLLQPRRFGFVSAETLILQTEATFRAQSDDSELRLLRHYGSLDLLIIDDLGVRDKPTAHATRLLDELAKRREAKGTIWTSNLSIDVLSKLNEGMQRITSRIAGECGDGARYVVKFSGPDRRNLRSRNGRSSQ